VRAIADAGHEIAHHGHRHLRSDRIDATEQRAEIEHGLAALAEAGAARPVGYRSPAWELTPETFDLLLEHGFAYDSSCMGDDRPYWETWGGRRILELPVHWSLDDWPRFGWSLDRGGNVTDPAEMYRAWLAEYDHARDEGRHVTYTTHPEVIGRGQRFVEFARLVADMAERGDTWFAPLADVAAHVRPHLAG
jgi:peptidoglycan/xylan/chitin deacetylase (PgdA/CDA1 family)